MACECGDQFGGKFVWSEDLGDGFGGGSGVGDGLVLGFF